jgi:hypothetical protein
VKRTNLPVRLGPAFWSGFFWVGPKVGVRQLLGIPFADNHREMAMIRIAVTKKIKMSKTK